MTPFQLVCRAILAPVIIAVSICTQGVPATIRALKEGLLWR
jgi:hypothetical protein